MVEHRRGANLPAIGAFNRRIVLDTIRRSPDGVSRVEIAARSGLSAQAISSLTRHLLESGMVIETGTITAGRGKPRTILQLDPGSRFAVGVHLDPAVLTSVLLDLSGRLVARTVSITPTEDDPLLVEAAVAAAVDELVELAGVSREAILGVGIASPGPIDRAAGVVLDPPFLPRWRDVTLREDVAAATGLPVLLDKDVIAAAVGETFLAGEGAARNLIFVYYGTGLGVGLVVDHELVRGVSSNAGDAGHIIVEQHSLADESVGQGGRGEIGGTVAPQRLVALATARGIDLGELVDCDSGDPEAAAVNRAWDRLAAQIDANDPAAIELASETGAALGRAVVVILNLLDADRVIFGGPFWSRIESAALPAAAAAIRGSSVLVPKHPIAVESSSVGEDVAAVGAACLVLDAALSPRASTMLIAV